MTKLYIRVCYLCNNKGELKEATHTYRPQDEEFDVCEECAELCREQGFEVWELIGETEIEQN